MAKGQYLSPHQKGIVKRYYENKEDLMTQKLGELVSEIYLNTSEKKAWALWERARVALYNAGAYPWSDRPGCAPGRISGCGPL